MRLTVRGNIKPYYVQMLLMLFFPGAKFPENETPSPDVPEVTVTLEEQNDAVTAKAAVTLGDRTCKAEHTEKLTDSPSVFDNRHAKIVVGKAVFDCCRDLLGVTPPWGTLTGVRPAKVATEYLDSGMDRDAVVSVLTDKYCASNTKASLAVDVALAEKRIITPRVREECSLYIAIPFCPSRCSYCSFVSYTSDRLLSMIPDYLTALADDIEVIFNAAAYVGQRISTVYIGGGTPTVLSEKQLEFLLSHIEVLLGGNKLDEFTLEAGRPDTITSEKLLIAKAHGVDRISVNTQTLNNDILRAIGRRHTAKDYYEAYDRAVRSGIRSINVDLIAGLPKESAESFSHSLDGIIALAPQNITVHTFSVKKSAEIRENDVSPYDADGVVAGEAVAYSQSALSSSGYPPYYMYRQKNTVGNLENVGYARPGYEGLYNVYMMEEVQSIFAAGASAVTKLVSLPDSAGKVKLKRIFQPKYPYEYLKEHGKQTKDERLRRLIADTAAFYREFR